MREIICPHCGETVVLDAAGHVEAVKQNHDGQPGHEFQEQAAVVTQEELESIEPVQTSIPKPRAKMSAGPLFDYPLQYLRGSEPTLAKHKIYQAVGADTHMKQDFVRQVAKVRLQCILYSESPNLPAGPGVEQILIYSVGLWQEELSERVLRCIDRAARKIPRSYGYVRNIATIFELHRRADAVDWETQVVAALVWPSLSNRGELERTSYFASAWLPSKSARSPMPRAENLGELYAALLEPLVPHVEGQYEPVYTRIIRAELAAKLQEIENWKKTRYPYFAGRELQREIDALTAILQKLEE